MSFGQVVTSEFILCDEMSYCISSFLLFVKVKKFSLKFLSTAICLLFNFVVS